VLGELVELRLEACGRGGDRDTRRHVSPLVNVCDTAPGTTTLSPCAATSVSSPSRIVNRPSITANTSSKAGWTWTGGPGYAGGMK
jgi:hypothetical protein